MKKIELIPASRATRIGTNKTSSSGDENVFARRPWLTIGSRFDRAESAKGLGWGKAGLVQKDGRQR